VSLHPAFLSFQGYRGSFRRFCRALRRDKGENSHSPNEPRVPGRSQVERPVSEILPHARLCDTRAKPAFKYDIEGRRCEINSVREECSATMDNRNVQAFGDPCLTSLLSPAFSGFIHFRESISCQSRKTLSADGNSPSEFATSSLFSPT